MLYNDIKHVLPVFQFSGTYVSAEELQSGNINNTYHLKYALRDGSFCHYTLQHINSYVFKKPEVVMNNIEGVTSHLARSLQKDGVNPSRHVLTLIPTVSSGSFYRDSNESYWRAYVFIDGATAYDEVKKPEHFYEAGRAFGEFQRRLNDFDIDSLVETIPNFHNSTRRFYSFVDCMSRDPVGRVKFVEREIDEIFDRRRMMNSIVKLLETGKLPIRVTHNDTKINNVMIDDVTGKALCVIDLDTVMPGSSLYDFGDAIRFGASTAAEDEEDVSRISLDMDKYEMFTKGFVEETRGVLESDELEMLPLGVKVITCELAMRFLADYIDGDMYFKVKSPEHNLVRARAQLALLKDIERKEDEMQRIVNQYI